MIKFLNKIINRKYYKLELNFVDNSKYLNNMNIVITGGTSGIGYEIANRAMQLGANVLIIGRNKEKLEKIEKELKCNILEWDINQIDLLEEKIDRIMKIFNGRIDCLINNAGIYNNSACLETDSNIFDSMINTNLKAPYFISKEIIKRCFIKQNKGNIIFISSNRGIMGDDCVYGISKSGVINFTKGLAKKYLNNNIRVNSIAPGMTTSNINGIKDTENLYAEYLKGKRVLSAREIAEIVMFFVSEASTCITGQVIACDNGESIL